MKLWRKPFDHTEQATALAQIFIDKERCKGCGFCVEFCHRKVLKMSTEIGPKGYKSALIDDENKCLNCGFCEVICPEFAIKLTPLTQTQPAQEALAQ
jgi:2-oxoglutarate ferredoxin oxidoreductase subunit delta